MLLLFTECLINLLPRAVVIISFYKVMTWFDWVLQDKHYILMQLFVMSPNLFFYIFMSSYISPSNFYGSEGNHLYIINFTLYAHTHSSVMLHY